MTRVDQLTYLRFMFTDCRLVELRHIDKQGSRTKITSGIFDNANSLQLAARSLAARGNSYTLLNCRREIPDPRRNRLAVGGRTTADDDIETIVRLPFDFDAVQPGGCCSTTDELTRTLGARDTFVRRMHRREWPVPLVGMSGNGGHVLYRCRMPNTPENSEMLTHLYHGLKEENETEAVTFDASVRNPARIFRLYGTINRKGPDAPDRPHRIATVDMPSRVYAVRTSQVERLANALAARPTNQHQPVGRSPGQKPQGAGDFRTLDAVSWLQQHGLYKRAAPGDSGKHFVSCPWASEHSSADHPMGTDTVIWADTGAWPVFHCSHAHCESRKLVDVIALLGDADSFCMAAWGAEK